MSGTTVEIPSFFDFDEPDLGEVSVDEPKADETTPEGKEAKGEEGKEEPRRDEDIIERLARMDAEREMARKTEEHHRAVAEQNRRRWQELHKPPELPTGEEAESLVVDPNAVIGLVKKNQEWTKNLLGAYGGAMNQLRQELAATIEQAQMQTAVATLAASRVSSSVANKLRAEGYDGIEEAMDAADEALAGDPARYLAYRTSPEHFEQAVLFVLKQNGKSPARRSNARVASGPTMPYTPGAPTPTSAEGAADMSRADIAKAQRLLGHKFSADLLRRHGVTG